MVKIDIKNFIYDRVWFGYCRGIRRSYDGNELSISWGWAKVVRGYRFGKNRH